MNESFIKISHTFVKSHPDPGLELLKALTEHVSDAYSTVSTHLCLHFILKNHAKSKLDSNIVANLWVIEANYKSQ